MDTNVLVSLFDKTDTLSSAAGHGLEQASENSRMFVSAPVYVELCAMPPHITSRLDGLLAEMSIHVEWQLDEAVWRMAANANSEYVNRRRKNIGMPRRVAADFLIGAHAVTLGASLLTFDQRTFKGAFPTLDVIAL